MPSLFYGILAITIGLMLLFFGTRLFRTVLATCSFISGSLFTFITIMNVREQHNLGPHGDALTLIFCLAIGVLSAILGLYMWTLALIVMGALGGFSAAMYILTWKGGHIISNTHAARPLFLTAATILGGLLAVIYERSIIMLATCLIGSISLCSGVDIFANTGFNALLQAVLQNRDGWPLDLPMYTLIGSCIFVAFLGIIVQLSITDRSSSK